MLPPPQPGTALRILATTDLGAHTVPLRTSYGRSGTVAGVVELLDRERGRGPAIWLDVGDLVVGNPAYPLTGERPWAEVANLPIAASAAGNHEFDDGVEAMLAAASTLSFPLLCANVDCGLRPAALLDTGAGPLGAIGLTHPASAQFSSAPPPADGWQERVRELAAGLRRDGARWVVTLLHDGVEWWPEGPGIATRSDRLEDVARPWAEHVDLILCGHNFGDWAGALAGTPAGEPHLFASSVLVVDLAEAAVVRGVFRVPPVTPAERSPAVEAVEAAATRIVGETGAGWLTRTGAEHYLPDLIADALRRATGAEAGFVMPSYHGIQAPFDGAIAALGPGPVSELDVLRMFADPGYEAAVAELRPGELRTALAAYAATADPRNTDADRLHWNWCRMPAGTSVADGDPETVALIPAVAAHLSEWLGRDVTTARTGVTARDALVSALG